MNTQICDSCGEIENPEFMFWDFDLGEYETKNQIKALDVMQNKGFDCICEKCFFDIAGANHE